MYQNGLIPPLYYDPLSYKTLYTVTIGESTNNCTSIGDGFTISVGLATPLSVNSSYIIQVQSPGSSQHDLNNVLLFTLFFFSKVLSCGCVHGVCVQMPNDTVPSCLCFSGYNGSFCENDSNQTTNNLCFFFCFIDLSLAAIPLTFNTAYYPPPFQVTNYFFDWTVRDENYLSINGFMTLQLTNENTTESHRYSFERLYIFL